MIVQLYYMNNTQKKKLIKTEHPTARCIYASDTAFVYYFELSAGSVHVTADENLGEVCLATKLLKWIR